MLLLLICTATVPVVRAGLALKLILDLLGFFALWPIADMVVKGFCAPGWAGIDTAQYGVSLWFVLFQEDLGRKDAI